MREKVACKNGEIGRIVEKFGSVSSSFLLPPKVPV